MSLENAKNFIKRMQCDADFVNQFEVFKSKEERQELLEKNGFLFTQEEINRVLEEIGLDQFVLFADNRVNAYGR